MATKDMIVPPEYVASQKVLLDRDLAELYGVTTKKLNQQVRRNFARFPRDFMFRLTAAESAGLRSQIATSNGHGGRRYLPYAFTEHGALMAATVLNTERAAQVSIYVVRAFVKIREMVSAHHQLARKIDELEAKVGRHDEAIGAILDAIRMLMEPLPQPAKKRIGFDSELEGR